MNLITRLFKKKASEKGPITIVDVGCRWGFAERFIKSFEHHDFKVYGFDPDIEECRRLEEYYKSLPHNIVSCIPLALAGRSGQRNLHITKEPACSSLHQPIAFLAKKYPALECIKREQTVKVDVTTLDNWARHNDIGYIDYLKLDTQGSELEILRGGKTLLKTARCIDIEVEFNPIYKGQSLFGETDSYLRSKGFVLWRLSNLVHYSLGGALMPLDDKNTICFDENVRQENDAYGGQLFWADARYVHEGVLAKRPSSEVNLARDLALFGTLGMEDVVSHIEKLAKSP